MNALGWIVGVLAFALAGVGLVGMARATWRARGETRCARGLHLRYWAEPGRWRCRRCGLAL